MLPRGHASGYLNIYFAFGMATLLKTGQKKAVKRLRLKSKRQENFLCTPIQASTCRDNFDREQSGQLPYELGDRVGHGHALG